MSWAQGLARGACRTAAETLKREPEPVASPAAARFGGSLLSTPLGPKVYSEAAAPHGGSCVHAAWPRSRRLRALTLALSELTAVLILPVLELNVKGIMCHKLL